MFDRPFDQWDTPLTESERDSLVETTARKVVERGLSVPAILALEMHRPVAFTLGQGIVAATPLLGPLVGLDRISGITRVLCAPGGIESLVRRIEDLSDSNDSSGSPMQTCPEKKSL